MSVKTQRRASLVLGWQLRALSALQLVAGAGYIAFACVLQWPPGDLVTAGLWIIGALAIVCSVTGFVAGCRVRCCLPVYVTLAVLATLAQTAVVLYLLIAPDQAVTKLSEYQGMQDKLKHNLDNLVNIGRWVLLGLLAAQVLAIALAIVMKCCTRSESYLAFEEAEEYERQRAEAEAQMEKLRSKVLLGEPAEQAMDKKRVISLTAVSGSTAAAQQRAARAALFGNSEDAKLEEAEGGRISSRTGREPSGPLSARAASQPPPSAWPSAERSPQPRSFRATWFKAGKP
eukprot:scaffold3.g6285.t1